ncbi:MAG: hypothetical protein CMD82_03780 [Gammaproteobacteria bacterium]|nr:hypothetical protein [Gammaproteobacteria bacterium]
MIKLENISKSFGTKYVFNDFNHNFYGNGLSIINGPNGCGKTTLLKIMSNVIRPDSGNILFPSKLNLDNDIGYVFQKPLMLKRNIWDNLLYIVSTKQKITQRHKDICLKLLMDFYDDNTKKINNLFDSNIFKLSGGEQQIISLARTLILKPRLLFLDEPFSHLDDQRAKKLVSLIQSYSENSKIVMVTHRLDIVKHLTDDILYLK